jgi:hypothetical protein
VGSILRVERLIEPPFPITSALKDHELRVGRHYAATHGGELPSNQFWEYMIYRHDLAPVRFDHYHPRFASLLDYAEYIRHLKESLCPPMTLLPNTPYWNYLRYRHDLNPARFDHYHPRLGHLLDLDLRYRQTHPCMEAPEEELPITLPPIPIVPIPTPTPTPPSEVAPEPSSFYLCSIGLLLAFLLSHYLTRK